jgi:hypothetical protein
MLYLISLALVVFALLLFALRADRGRDSIHARGTPPPPSIDLSFKQPKPTQKTKNCD